MVELPAPLTETGPFYTTVEAGDIVYWNPRNSVTVIYAPTVPVSELTKLGEVTSDLNAFADLPENVDLRIERGQPHLAGLHAVAVCPAATRARPDCGPKGWAASTPTSSIFSAPVNGGSLGNDTDAVPQLNRRTR